MKSINQKSNIDWRKTSEDEDTESIVDYYIEKNILKNPKDYKMGSSLHTDWFDSLSDEEKKVYFDEVGEEWGERFLPQNYIKESDDLEPLPTELPINIPNNPFMSGDGSDGIERDELTSKQNMMFMDYLMRKGWSFGDWWEEIGKERIREHIIDVRNDGDIDYTDEIGWWKDYLNENMYVLGGVLLDESCSLYKRIYIPKKVRDGGFKELKKWEQEYFLKGITKGYWDKSGNHIGDNSNPFKKKRNRITE